jgi:hypothetical protein
MLNRIPKSFTVGGQDIEVKHVEFCEDSCLGNIILSQGEIQIAKYVTRGIEHSETSKLNTFYHELTHAILRTMGEYELNNNEQFVCSFSGFLTEAVRSFKYNEDGE